MVLKCGVGEDSCKEIQPVHPKGDQSWVVHWKDWCWSWNSNTLATWCKEMTHLKRPWCWERLRAGGEGEDRGWDGWMTSPNRWTWVWVDSGNWWWTESPGVLQFMRSQELDTTERLNQTEYICKYCSFLGLILILDSYNAMIHGVAKSQTRPSDWTELNWMLP